MSKFLLALAATATLLTCSAEAQTRVKIGILNDQSGLYADIAGMGSVVAAKMAADDFVAKNSDFKVEIISADHQNKADIGSAIARRWYDLEGVDAIADLPTASVALAVNEITRKKNKIMLISGGGSSDMTGKACSPNSIHWTYDSWAMAHGAAALSRKGDDTFFVLAADYAFGHAMLRDLTEEVNKAGGKVIGSVNHPLNSPDFSSFLLQAQASKAKVVGLANAGGDTITAIKQAQEFGLVAGGQKIAALLAFISDIHSLGLQVAQGLIVTEAFYWDKDDRSRAFSQRFAGLAGGKMPTMAQAGVYSSVLHYLKAVKAAGSTDAGAVMARMKSTPVDDDLFGKGKVREDGRVIHDMYIYEVKKPSESKGPWDYYKLLATIPADEAFRPMSDGGCSLIAGGK
jgi:branched-chain amino acid transport system substrate-binding protein